MLNRFSSIRTSTVTFRTRQYFRVPRCLRMNGDDTRHDDRRVPVDDGLDTAVPVVDGHDSGSSVLAPTFANL